VLRRATGDAALRVAGTSGVGGGCIHHAARVDTTRGPFFAKWNDDVPADLFPAEAAGLEALRAAAGAALVVPRVVAVESRFLVLEYLAPGGRRDAEALGRGLAEVHRRLSDRYGFDRATYCGSTPQDNTPAADWATFYAERRLRPLLDALDLDARERSPFDRLIERLPVLVAARAVPSLIHGDLWSGNVLDAARGPALVDPACAYADREMEFGIATLFGGLSDRAFAAYDEAFPLEAGWRERNPLYQAYHLLNHALLFGGGYFAQARAIAVRFAG
jgi:fructosamine-3-kinase